MQSKDNGSSNEEDLLIVRAKSGDRDAFGLLVKRYQEQILALAYDLMGNYEDASDLAQEAFLRAFRSLRGFESRSRFSTWLYRITVNLSLDIHRSRKRRPLASLERHFETHLSAAQPEALIEWPSSIVEHNEVRLLLEKALDRLTESQRTATVLKYFHSRTCREIAEIMGCAEGTVRIHLHRAIHHLRKRLSKRDLSDE